jgi:hypothetical protein
MKKLKIIFLLLTFLICTSYTENTKLSLEEETLQIKKSLEKTEQGLIEIKKILDNPNYKNKIK